MQYAFTISTIKSQRSATMQCGAAKCKNDENGDDDDENDENGHDKDVFVCDVIQMFHMILTIHVKDITIENIFINSISFPILIILCDLQLIVHVVYVCDSFGNGNIIINIPRLFSILRM